MNSEYFGGISDFFSYLSPQLPSSRSKDSRKQSRDTQRKVLKRRLKGSRKMCLLLRAFSVWVTFQILCSEHLRVGLPASTFWHHHLLTPLKLGSLPLPTSQILLSLLFPITSLKSFLRLSRSLCY